ncbi:hypothetical protein EKO27_g10253 [Xylaria grammica]|uniref:TLC domain-containing protein n=1 Tax=Xylaria grammica TaxID=363999 RepID=A0A439CRQ8_9PEZI|nr:hypothetical protein EKO27_g10253 [Xylaria grammica]
MVLFQFLAGLSFNLIALIFLTHLFIPKARPHTVKFFTLSYNNPESGAYAIGGDDYHFIAFCIVLFTGLRAGLMEHLFAPLAKQWGLEKRKDMTRFSEQAWLLVYYSFFWPLGVYLYYNSPSFMNLRELWTGWPDREVTGLVKAYFLGQWAFWLQQVMVIHIEERRKDHWQMLTHHFITIALMAASYYYHHTRVGILILVLMDIVDIFLPLAKCLKYLGFSTLCDVMFGMFMVSWFLARHVLYMAVCWSIWRDAMDVMPIGCFYGNKANLKGPLPIPDGWRHWVEPFRNPEGALCFSQPVVYGFLYTLLGLQAITIFWFFMIIRVAVRVLRGGSADDPRSDDEVESEAEYEYEEAQPLEEEVGVESIDLKGWERRTGVKRAASSSAVSLPGHSDRKELLGRIGSDDNRQANVAGPTYDVYELIEALCRQYMIRRFGTEMFGPKVRSISPYSPSHPPLPFRFDRKTINSLESGHKLPASALSGHPASSTGTASSGKVTVRRSLDETVGEILRKIEEGTRRVVTLNRDIRAELDAESKLARENEAVVEYYVSLLGRLADIVCAYRRIQRYVRYERDRVAGEAREPWAAILYAVNLGVFLIDQAETFSPAHRRPLFTVPEASKPRGAGRDTLSREQSRIKEPESPKPKSVESELHGLEQSYSDYPPRAQLLYALVCRLRDL